MIILLLFKSLLCLVINFVYIITNKINKIIVKQKILMKNHSFIIYNLTNSHKEKMQHLKKEDFHYKMNASVNLRFNEHLIPF